MKQPEIRFNGFSDEWVEGQLKDVLKLKNTMPAITQKSLPVLTSSRQGLMNQSDYYKDRNVSSKDLSKYHIVFENDITYRQMSDDNVFAFNQNKLGYPGLVSPAYPVIRNTSHIALEYLMIYLNNSVQMKRAIHLNVEGTTRTSLPFAKLSKFPIKLPTLSEQQKIGSLFSKYDAIIGLREQKLEELNALKKGLLQQMFDDGQATSHKPQATSHKPQATSHKPQVRFSGFNDVWVEKKLGEMFDIKRGKVLAKTDVSMMPTSENKYPVYSSQTKDSGLMGYSDTWLFEDGITWTTDGANAGTVNYRSGKFFSTNVNGVLLKKTSVSNRFVAIAFGNVSKNYVTYIANPKLMSNIVSDISIKIPTLPEQQKIGQLFKQLDDCISNEQAKIEQLKAQKQGLLQRML